jgi:DNA-binding NtrC family response regulator/ABC-type branched-subunit amino acid transport system substrate-binding protein
LTTKIGLLYSLTGPTSIVEIGQYQASLLAIETINKKTSLALEPVVSDIKSEPLLAAKAAHDLLSESHVDVVVGCYTSACRKAILPVLEEKKTSLIYPTIYEGEECHPRVFYCGAVPNQQVDPLLSWAIANISNQFILVGSDYVYPRTIHRHVENFVERAGGAVLLDKYFPLGSVNFEKFLLKLKKMFNTGQSLVLFSTLVGNSVPAFYRQYRKLGLKSPIFSPITSEVEFSLMGKEAATGHFCSQGYFESLNIPSNQTFIQKYQTKFGNKPVNGVMESAFEAVHLYANSLLSASEGAHSRKDLTELFRKGVHRYSFDAPQGKVMMDCRTQHVWQWSRIARVNDLGTPEVIWSSSGPIPPRPYANLSDGLSCPDTAIEIRDQDAFDTLIGNSVRFRDSVRIAKIASKASSNVLLVGETGTGKDLFAKAIHKASSRRSGPFVPVNCAAIPRDLIGSELFGYEGGAFTGANKEGMAGKIELSNRGTLFLDEVGEMPLEQQGNLLRVVQDQEVYRIGSSKPIKVDIRIISATNRPILSDNARVGHFRNDLYYRLNVFAIEMPPLRNRKDDIPILANHFLKMLNTSNNTEKLFADETMGILQAYTWPGNVRELQNAIERAFFVASNSKKILPCHLSDSFKNIFSTVLPSTAGSVTHFGSSSIQQQCDTLAVNVFPTLQDNEVKIISDALSVVGSNRSKASLLLGISRSTLYRKMKRYSISID